MGRDCNGTKEEIMFIKIVLIILTIIAYTVFIMPGYFEMPQADEVTITKRVTTR